MALDLHLMNGSEPPKSVAMAVEAAIRSHENGVINEVVDFLCALAEEIDSEEDPDDDSIVFDGVASLLYAAMELESRIPLEDRKPLEE